MILSGAILQALASEIQDTHGGRPISFRLGWLLYVFLFDRMFLCAVCSSVSSALAWL